MEESDGADAVEAIFEGCEGRGLGKQHEEAVEAFVEVGVFFRFEKLETEI